jgi:cobalt-zinc-cadmium efflux system membrane fusion protein
MPSTAKQTTPRTIFTASLLLVLVTAPVLAHGGHDDAFKENKAAPTAGQVRVPNEVQKSMGLVVQSVAEKNLSTGFAVNGKIEAIPAKNADINAPLAGRVLSLAATRGQQVKAKQTIAILDSSEIRQLAVESERSLVQARTTLRQAQARLQLTEGNYRREKELVALKISPRRDFEVALAERDQAKTELEAARSQIQLSNSLLTSRLAQLGQNSVSARADGSIKIVSPIAGIVSDQQVTSGEAVEPGKVLYKIVNLSEVWATAQVYEKDLSKVRLGQTIEVVINSYPGRTFRGRIASLDPTVDPETRTVAVRAVLKNAQGLLKPEMFATLRVVTGSQTRPVVMIPRSAVLDVDGEKIVYVQNGEAFVPTEVKLGQINGDFVQVTDGIFSGDLVVTQRAFQLRAQALKGSFPAEDSASGEVKADKDTPPSTGQAVSASANFLPLSAWLLGGVLLSVGGFFTGMQVAKKGSPTKKILGEGVSVSPDTTSRSQR